MHGKMLHGLVLGCLSLAPLAGQAQEKPISKPELLPAPTESSAQPCPTCEKKYTTYKLHWLERDGAPAPVLKLKELTNQEPVCTYELDWREEQRIKTEIVLKPREIVKEVTTCTMEPKTVIDPVTGCRSVEWKPVTETKLVKDIVFDACPEDKIYTVKFPYLKNVDKIYTYKKFYLEHDLEKRVEKYGVLVPIEVTEKVPQCQQPPCSTAVPNK